MPRVSLFAGMRDVVAGFPLAESVRAKVLDHLYAQLAATLPADPRAVVLRAARHVPDGAAGTALVAGIEAASREVMGAAGLVGLGEGWKEWTEGLGELETELVSEIDKDSKGLG